MMQERSRENSRNEKKTDAADQRVRGERSAERMKRKTQPLLERRLHYIETFRV